MYLTWRIRALLQISVDLAPDPVLQIPLSGYLDFMKSLKQLLFISHPWQYLPSRDIQFISEGDILLRTQCPRPEALGTHVFGRHVVFNRYQTTILIIL